MYLGNTQITEMYLGTSPISEVWLGTTKVWNQGVVTTYEVVDPTLYYSSGTYLKSDASNYAYVLCKLNIYENGVLKETKPSWRMNVTSNTPVTNNYLTYTDNLIKFNIATYGTTDMSNQSNPMTIAIIPSAYGVTGATQYLKVEPNRITSTSLTDYTCSGIPSTTFLSSSQTSFTVTNKNTGEYTTKYTSGKQTTETKGLEGYLYETNQESSYNNLVGSASYNGTITVNVSSTNTLNYPRIFIYRLTKQQSVTTGYDDWIYMLQKSNYNSSGMQLYYANTLINENYVISSTPFYVANNGHTANTIYNWYSPDSDINVEIQGGIFYISGVHSSTDTYLEIVDNYGNKVTFDIMGA